MEASQSPPRVGVVLLNWNGGADTIPCIASLQRGTVKPWRIVVVDNASTDTSPDDILNKFPDVQLVRNPTNVGFAPGNNIGIRLLCEARADYIWILNNDTEVAPDCLEQLINTMERDPAIGAASAKILFVDPSNHIWYAGGHWNSKILQARHIGERELDRGQYDRAGDTEFLSGCCMFIRRSAIERIGAFADEFFIYMEDSDWCQRAAKEGIRLYYAPSAVLIHKVSAAMKRNTLGAAGGRISARFIYLTTRNQLWIIRRYGASGAKKFRAILHLLPLYLRTLIVTTGLLRWGKTRALLTGIRDGFRQ